MSQPRLILASSSPYRADLLRRLHLQFEQISPDVDESPRTKETPAQLAERLAVQKAQAVASAHPDAVIIGSDQVPALGNQPLSKPGARARAIEMLHACNGREVVFHTGLAVIGPDQQRQDCINTTVCFRDLTDEEIAAYVDADEPFDCAGAFRAEKLGICLFKALHSDDPTALIGLPLIATARMLRELGINPLRAGA